MEDTHRAVYHANSRKIKDPLPLITCKHFKNGMAPFDLNVQKIALLVMDFHAHLSETEVIGLLGGTWNRQCRQIQIRAAYPCRSIEAEGSDPSISVEMDPESEFEAREKIAEDGLRVVGWYHSHPIFRPEPSSVDIENQLNYQTLFRDSDDEEAAKSEDALERCKPSSAVEPFVGVIVSPYWNTTREESLFQYFYVGRGKGTQCSVPYCFSVAFDEDAQVGVEVQLLFERLCSHYRTAKERVCLAGRWKRGVTKIVKLYRSLHTWIPSQVPPAARTSLLKSLLKFLPEFESLADTECAQSVDEVINVASSDAPCAGSGSGSAGHAVAAKPTLTVSSRGPSSHPSTPSTSSASMASTKPSATASAKPSSTATRSPTTSTLKSPTNTSHTTATLKSPTHTSPTMTTTASKSPRAGRSSRAGLDGADRGKTFRVTSSPPSVARARARSRRGEGAAEDTLDTIPRRGFSDDAGTSPTRRSPRHLAPRPSIEKTTVGRERLWSRQPSSRLLRVRTV
eukprot:Rmarinus@m.15382